MNKYSDAYGPYANVPYDGNDLAYRDFYFDNDEHAQNRDFSEQKPWYTQNKKFQAYSRKRRPLGTHRITALR
ncbi:putative alpha-L-fucosidase [Paenibacillus agaridevorans]|uniref:Putative alpha-L-fucosidase n=1 Tax=Paenibacillus agaridevorans TaxID=171404 RepID=A0A2R5ER59_9BACL|nr:hypothetical protein [Paenibacillus agaridevorans]GBG09206.1 putative alpha-L-fucosidase [Paenibacillus agaridevorans]